MGKRRQTFGAICPKDPKKPNTPPFFIRWWEGNVRRKVSGFKSMTAAAEALARVQVGLSDGTLVNKRKGAVLFEVVGDAFMKTQSAALDPASHRVDESHYRIHVMPFFEGTPMKAITHTRMLEFKAHLKKSTYTVRRRETPGGEVKDVTKVISPRMVNHVLSFCRRLLNFAVVDDYIAVTPLAKIKRGKLMNKIGTVQLAPPLEHSEDVSRVLETIRQMDEESPERSPLHGFFAALFYLGLRRGEAAGLRWEDISFHRETVKVAKSYKKNTKGRAERTVGLPYELVPILKAHREACPHQGELVFPHIEGTMYTPNTKVEWVLQAALDRLGLPRMKMHDTRHQFACTFLENGGDLYTLSLLLGHSTYKITADTYAHLSKRFLAGEKNRISYAPRSVAKVVNFPNPSAPYEAGSTRVVPGGKTETLGKDPSNSENPQ